MPEETDSPLIFVAAAMAEPPRDRPYVAVVHTREEFERWLSESAPGVQWLQIEGLLDDAEIWALAAQGSSRVPLDVMVWHPAEEYSHLYRLADVRLVRDVRVTMPATAGFMKAVKLAASLEIPVRLLPGQPSAATLAALAEAMEFYLHDPAVDAPIEPFHSLLAGTHSADSSTLWEILECDPAIFAQVDASGRAHQPRDFVARHFNGLIEDGAECVHCQWRNVCVGYFKWPDPAYGCLGVQRLFSRLAAAAKEIRQDGTNCVMEMENS